MQHLSKDRECFQGRSEGKKEGRKESRKEKRKREGAIQEEQTGEVRQADKEKENRKMKEKQKKLDARDGRRKEQQKHDSVLTKITRKPFTHHPMKSHEWGSKAL